MKYIRTNEQKTRQEKKEAENDVYIKQTNILIDQLVKCRNHVNNRIKEVFDYDVNEATMDSPFPCNVVVYTESDNGNGDGQMFDISNEKKLNDYRKYGRFLANVNGKCEIDFLMIYNLYLPSDFKYKKKRTVDETLLDYGRHAKKMVEIVENLTILKQDLGDMKIHRIRDIDTMDENGEYTIMFELRRKNRIKIDPVDWIKKINT
jgi:hypothetical protein